MAGPTASILFAQILNNEQRLTILNEIAELSELIEGYDFWIQERPFIVSYGPEYKAELDEYVTEGLSGMLGWTPKDTIHFAAMCNSQIDHRILGEICLHFANSLNGVVDFGGELPSMGTNAPNELFTVSYEVVPGRKCKYHIGSPEFLGWWLNQSEFMMVN